MYFVCGKRQRQNLLSVHFWDNKFFWKQQFICIALYWFLKFFLNLFFPFFWSFLFLVARVMVRYRRYSQRNTKHGRRKSSNRRIRQQFLTSLWTSTAASFFSVSDTCWQLYSDAIFMTFRNGARNGLTSNFSLTWSLMVRIWLCTSEIAELMVLGRCVWLLVEDTWKEMCWNIVCVRAYLHAFRESLRQGGVRALINRLVAEKHRY